MWEKPLATRYASAEMARLWSDRNRYRTWRQVWLALAEAEAELGLPITPAQLAQLRAKPGGYSFASSGSGSSTHLTGELFQQMTKTEMVHVPYKGTGPLLNDLMAGHVPLGFDQITAVLPFTQSGKLRALGVASLERSAAAPDIPTIAEVVPGFEAIAWMGLLGPAGTPTDIVSKINSDIRRVLQSPEASQKLRELAATPGTLAPQAFADFVRQDTEKWRALVKSANIKAD